MGPSCVCARYSERRRYGSVKVCKTIIEENESELVAARMRATGTPNRRDGKRRIMIEKNPSLRPLAVLCHRRVPRLCGCGEKTRQAPTDGLAQNRMNSSPDCAEKRKGSRFVCHSNGRLSSHRRRHQHIPDASRQYTILRTSPKVWMEAALAMTPTPIPT